MKGLTLVCGDLACFAVFAVLGLNSHGESFTVTNALRAAGTFAFAWILLAGVLGQYEQDAAPPSGRSLALGWSVAWLIGVVARSLIFDRPLVSAFSLVSFLVIGALLAGWRTAYALLEGALSRRTGETGGD